MELEQAFWILRHGSGEGLREYLKAIKTIEDNCVPVVRCKGCEYSCESIGYFICSHGVCCECIVQPDFYCAEGKRKEGEP